MEETLSSILDNVIFLDIETTGLDENSCEIIEIGAVKIKNGITTTYETLVKPRGRVPVSIYNLCSGLKQIDLLRAPSLNSIKMEFLNFVENMPLVCHNGNFERRFLRRHIPELNNKIMDSMELAAILEPWRKEFNLESLMHEVTNLKKNEMHRGLEDSIDTLKVVNSLLCRQWNREESMRKKKTLYLSIKKEYDFLSDWDWTEYLVAPAFFNYADYNYVNYEEEKKSDVKLENIKIDYKKFEDLLKDEKIWNNGGDFGYVYRKDQKEFAKKIRENFEKEERIFIEAPTGSGKTFAYVIIAAIETYLNKLKNRKDESSFVISTNTKELQNQLIEKDIPIILNKLRLNDKLNYGAMKGKGNYLCIDRMRQSESLTEDFEGNLAFLFFKRLCEDGKYGDIENISYWAYKHFNLDKYIKEVNCDKDSCNLEKCNKVCYLRRRYNELPMENITVINHSLLSCWPYNEKKKINHLIIDEAHNLMEKCYDFFAEEFSSYEFLELLESMEKGHPSIIAALLGLNASFGFRETIEKDRLKYIVEEIKLNTALLLNNFRSMRLSNGEYNFSTEFFVPRDDLKQAMHLIAPDISNLKESIYPLYKMLNDYLRNITQDEEVNGDTDYKVICDFILKIKGVFDVIDKFLEPSVFYAKILDIDAEYKSFMLRNVPLNVGEMVNEHMLKDIKSTTFLSATLRIENSFNNMKKHLGQEKANEFIIPAVFNLKQKTKIFAMNDMGSYDDRHYIKNISRFIFETAKSLNGHILVLFNNNIRRNNVHEELEILVRGTKIEVHTNKKAISALKDPKRQAIILGTKGFFEGIDVPGDALNCVMLDKLPNYSPEYPLLQAITKYQRKRYQDVNYPQLCIKVKQIYGRLIRSAFDYGYFIILDPGHNQYTLRSLERDLCGPPIIVENSKTVLNSMKNDYRRWKRYNLNVLINKLKRENADIESKFSEEASKHKSFWELADVNNGEYCFRNMDFELKGRI